MTTTQIEQELDALSSRARKKSTVTSTKQLRSECAESFDTNKNCVPEPLGDAPLRAAKTHTSLSPKRSVRTMNTIKPLQAQQKSKDTASAGKEDKNLQSKPTKKEAAAKHTDKSEQTNVSETPDYRLSVMDRIYDAYDRCMDVLTAQLTRRVAFVLLVCIALLAFLYEPARNLYVAQREQAILTARLDSINEQNQELSARLDALQTRDGIETEARKRGYVYEGEQLMNVSGIPQEQAQPASADTAVTENRSLLTEFLDTVFAFNASKI